MDENEGGACELAERTYGSIVILYRESVGTEVRILMQTDSHTPIARRHWAQTPVGFYLVMALARNSTPSCFPNASPSLQCCH